MTPYSRVFCDANVLYSSLLRDWLIRLALTGLYELFWSEAVQDEWIRGVLRDEAYSPGVLERTRRLMEQALPQARVSGFEHLLGELALPDPEDRHVLAAAIHSEASHLLTFNLKDFPDDVAAAYGIQVVHPDQWLSGLIAVFKPEVQTVTLRLLTALKNPPLTPAEFCAALERLHLPDTARLLRDLLS